MRRSSVRLRLWATLPTPVRSISYRGFLFLDDSCISFFWHTHGTLTHNKSRLIAFPRIHFLSGSQIRFNHLNECKFLLQCALVVPLSLAGNSSSLEIKALCNQVVALRMRRCHFWMIILYFYNFFTEIDQ
jgi:hypothetical protein